MYVLHSAVLNVTPLHPAGFMINFCAVMLELCKPFFSRDPSGQKLGLISAQYATSPTCRLNLHNEPCLAQGVVCKSERTWFSESEGNDALRLRKYRIIIN